MVGFNVIKNNSDLIAMIFLIFLEPKVPIWDGSSKHVAHIVRRYFFYLELATAFDVKKMP